MTKNFLTLGIAGILAIGAFTSCKKSSTTAVTNEMYQITGRIDASRTTIPTAALVSAIFTLSFNSANSFGDAQCVLNGNFKLTGYTGIPVTTTNTSFPVDPTKAVNTADTLNFFASQASGPAISYVNLPTTFTGSNPALVFGNYTTNLYTYNNTAAASFTITNFPFITDIITPVKEGKGYFRLGKKPNYVYILLDNVVKL